MAIRHSIAKKSFNQNKPLGMLAVVFTPFLFIVFIIITSISLFSFSNRKDYHNIQTEHIRDTTVFVETLGVITSSGSAVYQETPLKYFKMFYKKKLLCKTSDKYNYVTFEVVNDYKIICIKKEGKEKITLPY